MFAKLCTERFMGFESNYVKICIARKHFKILHSEMCTAESENQIVFKKCIENCGFSMNLYPKFEYFFHFKRCYKIHMRFQNSPKAVLDPWAAMRFEDRPGAHGWNV